MSYRKPDTGNSMNDYFSSLVDFTVVAPKLLSAKTPSEFNVWLEKLELIDRRSLLLYIRKHKDCIPDAHLDIARKRFVEKSDEKEAPAMKRPNPHRPENFQDTPMGMALEDLAKRMDEEDLPPVTINAVGGFALLLHGVRSRTCVTDIDYVGRPFSDKFNRIADEIGLAHQMGKGWINNDVMMAGISTKSFEFSTGELHFHEAFSVGNIKINVLDEKDLLRMKLIAVDTSVSGTDSGGEFTRVKDLPDVKALMDRQGVKSGDLYAKYGEWIQPSTQRVIQSYESGGEEAVYQEIDRRGKQYRDALRKQREARADTPYRPNPYLAQFIRTAQARADAEKDWEDDEDALC